jgi:hypothetical protein
VEKLVAISLLCLHLFSLYGHLALYEYFLYQSESHFNEKISMNKYSVDDLVLVKVPVNMPTIDDWKDYSYISGQIRFKDNSYNYVKLKMTKDTIYLMCIPNYKKTKLLNQNIIDARKIADIPISKKSHVPFVKAVALSDYTSQTLQYRFQAPVALIKAMAATLSSEIIKCTIASPAQPPEALNLRS